MMEKNAYPQLKPHREPFSGAKVDAAPQVLPMTGLASECISRPIVVACDEAYAMPLSTTLRSLLESNRSQRPIDVFVLTSEFPAEVKEKVLQSLPPGIARVHWVPVELASFKGFSTQPYISKMTYARLLLPYIFPPNVARVLYVDVDVLVLGDLSPLWEIVLDQAAVGAVVDTFSQDHNRRLGLSTHLKIPSSDVSNSTSVGEYFNAGVLLIDLPRWREERISERALQYLERHPQSLLSDQDALNVVCAGQWKQLDARWNLQTHDLGGYCRMPLEQRPSIIHFAGKKKPWLPSALDVNAAFYDSFRSRTQFARRRRDKVGDAMLRSWASSKRFLKQYKLISLVYKFMPTCSRNFDRLSTSKIYSRLAGRS